MVAHGQQLFAVMGSVLVGQVLAHVLGDVGVVLKQLDGQVARRVALADVLVGLQEFLYLADTVLNLVAVVDMDVARGALRVLIYLDDGLEQLLDAHARLERRGHHRHAEERGERLQVDRVAAPLKLVVHIEGADHADVHVDELRRQIEVALQVRGVDDVDDHIGHLLSQVLAHVEFLGRVAGQRIRAGQVGQREVVAVEMGLGLGGVDGHAAVVAHAGVCP